jgi:hypothetical protein
VFLLITAGCDTFLDTFYRPGSVYKETGSLSDLFAEPTMDVNGEEEENSWSAVFSYPPRFYSTDGHGVFDAAVVATEWVLMLPFSPIGLPDKLLPGFYGARLLPFDYHPNHASLGKRIYLKALTYGALAYSLVVGLPVSYFATSTLLVFDVAVHDVPVATVVLISRALHLRSSGSMKEKLKKNHSQ